MANALQNGRAYDHSSTIFTWLGVQLVSLSSMSWSDNQEKEYNYGTGPFAVSVGYGTKKVEASFTLSLNDVKAVEQALPTKDINDIGPSDIILTYLNPNNLHTRIIKNFVVTGMDTSSGTDDMDIKVDFTGIATHILKKS